eukprot:3410487-Ditylum_brightwellii.AAC.1
MKTHKKAFDEMVMRERQRQIDAMAIEVMSSCLKIDEFVGEERVQKYMGIQFNMMIQRDTEPRDNDRYGLVSDIDERTKKATFGMLSEATGLGYERIRKLIEGVANIKLPSMYYIAKDWPLIKGMKIVPFNTSNDEGA